MPEEFSDRAIIASVVALVSHTSDSQDEVSDAQISNLSRPMVAETTQAMDIIRQSTKRLRLVGKVGSSLSMLEATIVTERPAQ